MNSPSTADFWDYLEELARSHPLIIDRPRGSAHPRYPGLIYPLDYGYLESTSSADGGGIDVWLGTSGASDLSHNRTKYLSAVIMTVDLHKHEAEIKIMLDCSEEELQTVLGFHNEDGMRATLVRRPKH